MLDGLSFEAVPVRAPSAEVFKVSVLRGGAIKITLTAAAYARLGKPEALSIEAAPQPRKLSADFDWQAGGFLKLTAAPTGGVGWPVTERAIANRKPSATCVVRAHPFKPGLLHSAEAVDAHWLDDGAVLLTLPDWKSILADLKPAPTASAED